jgi:hypothetical protein
MYLTLLQLLATEYPDLVNVFQSMTAVELPSRPTMAEALESIHRYHDGFTRAQLKGPVPRPNLDGMSISQHFRRMEEALVRQEARKKKRLEEELAQTSLTPS